jgi:hypothetical protein
VNIALTAPEEVEVHRIPISRLRVDPNYQRHLDRTRVERMARQWSDRLCGALAVSDRADGTFYVVDGQHRYEALSILRRPTVPCFVWAGLSREQEADLFVTLNTERRAVRMDDRFRARLAAGDRHAAEIVAIAEQAGFSVLSNPKSVNDLKATSTLEKIRTIYGPDVLAETLSIIAEVWPTERIARQKDMLGGIGLFAGLFRSQYDRPRLVAILQKIPAAQLQREANGIEIEIGRTPKGGGENRRAAGIYGTAVIVARLIRERYDKGRRQKLPNLKSASGRSYSWDSGR